MTGTPIDVGSSPHLSANLPPLRRGSLKPHLFFMHGTWRLVRRGAVVASSASVREVSAWVRGEKRLGVAFVMPSQRTPQPATSAPAAVSQVVNSAAADTRSHAALSER